MIKKNWLKKTLEFRPDLLLLSGTALLIAIVYWFMFIRNAGLLPLYQRPRLDVSFLYDGGSPLRQKFIFAFIIQGILYLAGYWISKKVKGKAAWWVIIGGSLLFGLILSFLYPFDAADLFDNIFHGRILAFYRGNPFLQVISSYPSDPFYSYAAWKSVPSAYGPGWEVMAGAAAFLAGSAILPNILVFKLLPGLFMIGSLWMAALILHKVNPQQAASRTLLLAWNPVVLYETWGNGHNDIVLVFWILAAGWALLHNQHTVAVLALAAGALFKFIPVLLIPAAISVGLQNQHNMRARAQFFLKTCLPAAVLVGLVYFPFWGGIQVLGVERRMHLFSASLPAVIFHLISLRAGPHLAATWVSTGALFLTFLVAGWQGFKSTEKATSEDFFQASFNILAFYLLLACLWFQQWYTIWLLGLLPVLNSRQARGLALLFGFTALSKQFIFGPILLLPHPVIPQPGLEIRFTLGVLSPAWVYLAIIFVRSFHLESYRHKDFSPGRIHPVYK